MYAEFAVVAKRFISQSIRGEGREISFFDKLSKTVAKAGQKTIAKTKDLADISKLNNMISEEEKIINGQYLEIGKLYFSVHKNDYEEDFAEIIRAIGESEARIINYRKEIQKIKGVRYCEECGFEVPNEASFCSSCGATVVKVRVSESVDYVKCEGCGSNVKKGMRFCTSCGNPMEAVAPATVEYVSEEPVREGIKSEGYVTQGPVQEGGSAGEVEAEEIEPEKFVSEESAAEAFRGKNCSGCGANMSEDLTFCTECGTKL